MSKYVTRTINTTKYEVIAYDPINKGEVTLVYFGNLRESEIKKLAAKEGFIYVKTEKITSGKKFYRMPVELFMEMAEEVAKIDDDDETIAN